MTKLWRRLAKKRINADNGEVVRDGRRIANFNRQYAVSMNKAAYPFLEDLFEHAQIKVAADKYIATNTKVVESTTETSGE